MLLTFMGLRRTVRRRVQLRVLAVTRWVEHGKVASSSPSNPGPSPNPHPALTLALNPTPNSDQVYKQLPFRAWYLYVVDQQIRRKAQDAMVRGLLRRRGRAGLRAIVTAWRELARRDLPAEIRSRAQLVEALRAQEGCTARLEASMLEPEP